jgi:dipeptide/tripeptide permease
LLKPNISTLVGNLYRDRPSLRDQGFKMIMLIVSVTGVGFYIPSMVLWYLRSKRQQEIFLSLPEAGSSEIILVNEA